jgi:hypothetical protein
MVSGAWDWANSLLFHYIWWNIHLQTGRSAGWGAGPESYETPQILFLFAVDDV